MEVQAGGDRSANEDQERGRLLRCGQKVADRGLDVDVDGRENQAWLPTSQRVEGWLMVGKSAEEQVSETGIAGRRGTGSREIDLHLFLEGGYVSPNTRPSDGKEQVVFTCSRTLNKCFQ